MAIFDIKRGLDQTLYRASVVPDTGYSEPKEGDLIVATGVTSDGEFKVVSGNNANQSVVANDKVLIGVVFEGSTFSVQAIGKLTALFGFGEIETDNFNSSNITSSTTPGTALTCKAGKWDLATQGENKYHVNGYLKKFNSSSGTIDVVCHLE